MNKRDIQNRIARDRKLSKCDVTVATLLLSGVTSESDLACNLSVDSIASGVGFSKSAVNRSLAKLEQAEYFITRPAANATRWNNLAPYRVFDDVSFGHPVEKLSKVKKTLLHNTYAAINSVDTSTLSDDEFWKLGSPDTSSDYWKGDGGDTSGYASEINPDHVADYIKQYREIETHDPVVGRERERREKMAQIVVKHSR